MSVRSGDHSDELSPLCEGFAKLAGVDGKGQIERATMDDQLFDFTLDRDGGSRCCGKVSRMSSCTRGNSTYRN